MSPGPPQTVASWCQLCAVQLKMPRGIVALPSTASRPRLGAQNCRSPGRAERHLERRARRRRRLLEPPDRRRPRRRAPAPQRAQPRAPRASVAASAASPPAHLPPCGCARLRASARRRRASRRGRAGVGSTVESTASSATPESVSCSSSAWAVSSTALQLRRRTTSRLLDRLARRSARPRGRSAPASPGRPSRAPAARRRGRPRRAFSPIVTGPELLRHAERGDHRARERRSPRAGRRGRRSRRTPNSIRSPAAPATIAISWRRRSGSCMTTASRSVSMCAAVPSWRPRATIESFWRRDRLADRARRRPRATASWTRSPSARASVSTWLLRAGPATTRSIASSSVGWSISARPSRTVSSAASLITLASSAPVKPGRQLGDLLSEAPGPSGRLPQCRREDLERPCTSGTSTVDLAVEAARAQQRRVEDVGAVGGADHDDARRRRRSRPSRRAAG